MAKKFDGLRAEATPGTDPALPVRRFVFYRGDDVLDLGDAVAVAKSTGATVIRTGVGSMLVGTTDEGAAALLRALPEHWRYAPETFYRHGPARPPLDRRG